jgi:hypothetical protein
MTIVTYRYRPKRPDKAPVEIKVPRIVQHTPKGKAWRLRPTSQTRRPTRGLPTSSLGWCGRGSESL